MTLRAKVDWLVCEEICIPGSANLELSLPVGTQSAAANEELFAEFRGLLPAATAPPYALAVDRRVAPRFDLKVKGLKGAKAVDLYPLPPKGEQVEHPKNGPIRDGDATIALGDSGDLRGVLVVETEGDRKGWLVSSSEQQPVRRRYPAQVSAAGAERNQVSGRR